VSGFPLDPKPDDMRAMGEAALDHVVSFLEGLETAPADNSERGVAVAERLRAAPPELGGSFDDALEEFRQASAHTFEFAGPGYLAYIPGGGLFASAIADLLTLGTNRFVNLWVPAPGVVQIEQNVVRWLCDLFGYPDEARGILTSGGSLANFSAVVTARHTRLGEDFLDGVYYVSAQSHASVTKAAALAGFARRNARIIPTDAELRMDPEALRQQVRADRAAGLRPFLVVPAAGTTNTGAIDPLDAIADIAEQEELWMHVDAAYGGFFVLTDRGRERFRGVERADSVTLDPHKGMFLPYGTGSLVVRDGAALRAAHYEGAAYLQDLIAEGDLPNFSEYSPELSRDVRGLRVWLPLKLHGVAAFREALDEKLDLAEEIDIAFRAIPQLEVPWRTQLTVTPFRLRDGDDDANRQLLRRINASKRVFLSSTVIDDRYTLRVCIVSHRTHRDRILECIDIVRDAAESLAG
jgi:aromatic-L-amino-acid decarboxylase